MESMQSTSPVTANRENECRFCSKVTKNLIKITKLTRKKFLELTQTELQVSEKLSSHICQKCSKDLKNAHSYREKLIESQNKLYKEISNDFVPEIVSFKEEKVEFDEEVVESIENLKTRIKVEAVDEFKDDDFGQNLFDNFNYDDSTVNDHEYDDDDDDKYKVKSEPKKPVILKCDKEGCGQIFKTKRQLRTHKTIHKSITKAKRRTAICSYCGIELCSKGSLQTHIAAVHLQTPNYFCDICGYAAKIRTSIRSHMKVHLDYSERRKYLCDECDFTALSAEGLRRHIKSEHKGFSIACHCGKVFAYKAALQIHMRVVHLRIKNHECECGKKFYGKNELADHRKIHHTENAVMEFSCEECGKEFITKKQMTAHMQTHLEASFKCSYGSCDKAYSTQKKLDRHIKTHIGKRDFICHLCNNAYMFNKDLQRHLDVAHKQTTYFCELCSFTNNRKDYLGNHIRSAHNYISQEERNKMVARAKFVRNSV